MTTSILLIAPLLRASAANNPRKGFQKRTETSWYMTWELVKTKESWEKTMLWKSYSSWINRTCHSCLSEGAQLVSKSTWRKWWGNAFFWLWTQTPRQGSFLSSLQGCHRTFMLQRSWMNSHQMRSRPLDRWIWQRFQNPVHLTNSLHSKLPRRPIQSLLKTKLIGWSKPTCLS